MAGFADSVLSNASKMLAKVDVQCNAIARDLFLSIVDKTPSPANPGEYATGHLVNQWYPEVDDFSEELSGDTDENGAASRSRIYALNKLFTFLGKDGTLTLTNNLPYAYRAEALGWPTQDGWSGRQGPYRMVALSLQAIAAKYQ